jgi:hypothetical protein
MEEHICCGSRIGANAVNLGEEKKNMRAWLVVYIHTE